MVHHKTSFAMYLFLLTMTSCRGNDHGHVEMHLLFENSEYFIKYVTFNRTMFKRFHGCLCNNTKRTCVAEFNSNGPPFTVDKVETILFEKNDESFSNCQKCTVPADPGNKVQCKKIKNSHCNTSRETSSYQISGIKSCDFSCIRLLWTNRKLEKLTTTIHGFLNITLCPETPITQTPAPETSSSGDNTGVIVGVAIGILILIIIGVLFVILWRRGKRVFQRPGKSHHGLSASHTGNGTGGVTIASHHYLHHPTGKSSPSGNVPSRQDLMAQGGNNHIFKKDQHSDVPVNSYKANSLFSKSKSLNNNVDMDYGYSVAHTLEPDNEVKKKPPGVRSAVGYGVITSDDFGYSKAEDLHSPDVYGHSGITRGGKEEEADADFQTAIGVNLQSIPQQKKQAVGENTKIQSQPVNNTNLANEYDYAMPEDDGNSVPEQSRESVNTGTTDRSYEFCKLDDDDHSEGPEVKSAPADISYATAKDDYALSEGGYADYSLSADPSPKPKHVYTKLGEKVRHMKNPYNVHLHPKEDPKKRQPLPPPTSNTEPVNQKSTYSFVQPISDHLANPIVVINVDSPSSTNGTMSSDDQDDQGFSRSEFTLSTDTETAQDNKRTHSELEKQEDNKYSASSCSGESVQ